MTASFPRRALLVFTPMAAAAFLTLGCQQAGQTSALEPASEAASTETQAKGQAPALEPAKASEAIEFTSDPKAAISQAANDNKIVMVDVYTDWCTWCHKLDKDVYARQDIAAAVRKDFVALKVNPEKADADFVKSFGVEGFPTILFLDGKGKEVHRIVGYVPAEDFKKELETARTKAGSA